MEGFDYKKLLKAYMELIGDWEGVGYAWKLKPGDYGLNEAEVLEIKMVENEFQA